MQHCVPRTPSRLPDPKPPLTPCPFLPLTLPCSPRRVPVYTHCSDLLGCRYTLTSSSPAVWKDKFFQTSCSC